MSCQRTHTHKQVLQSGRNPAFPDSKVQAPPNISSCFPWLKGNPKRQTLLDLIIDDNRNSNHIKIKKRRRRKVAPCN